MPPVLLAPEIVKSGKDISARSWTGTLCSLEVIIRRQQKKMRLKKKKKVCAPST